MRRMGGRSLALAAGLTFAVALLWAGQHQGSAQEGTSPPAADEGASRLFRVSYRAEMDVPPGAAGARLWMPVPPSTDHQEVSDLQIRSNVGHRFYTEPLYGNTVVCAQQVGGVGAPVVIELSATVRRSQYRVIEKVSAAPPAPPASPAAADDLELFLGPNALVPITGRIEAEALKVVTPEMSDLEKARAMYDYLARTISYDKSEPGYGRGDALRACDVRKGNCSDFHSLFIGMSRAAKLPARFLMGFPLPPDRQSGEVPGYHCWAEFYLEDVGWVPVDISEASRHPERHEEFFGGLDADRVHFTTGRDIELCPGPLPGPQNYLIYPVGLVDGKVRTDIRWEFRFEDLAEGDD